MPNHTEDRYVVYYRQQGWKDPIAYSDSDLVALLNYCERCLTPSGTSWFILDRNTARVVANFNT